MSTTVYNLSGTFLPDRDVLFIDIDETIVRFLNSPPREGNGAFLGQSLFWLMCKAAERRGMKFQDAQQIVRGVCETKRWWDWSDFILALDLDPAAFWQSAYEVESQILGPTCPQLPSHFVRLKAAGFKMFITSNNPCSSSLHKLRLAGLGDVWGSPFIYRSFGPPEMQCMKQQPEFWRRVLAHTGLAPRRITVIGDSQIDDVESSRQAGISSAIRLDIRHEGHPVYRDGAWVVGSWLQIVELLEGKTSSGSSEKVAKPVAVANGHSQREHAAASPNLKASRSDGELDVV